MTEDTARAGLDLAGIEERLRAAQDEVTDGDETMYGFFRGGDPRRFTPDEDDCTPEEIERWRQACALWDQGIEILPAPDVPPSRVQLGDGTLVPLCNRDESFGIGIQRHDNPLGQLVHHDMPALLVHVRRLKAVADAARETSRLRASYREEQRSVHWTDVDYDGWRDRIRAAEKQEDAAVEALAPPHVAQEGTRSPVQPSER